MILSQELIRVVHLLIHVCNLSLPFLYILDIKNNIVIGTVIVTLLSMFVFKRCIVYDIEEKMSGTGIKADMMDTIVEKLTGELPSNGRYDLQYDINGDHVESSRVLRKRDKYLVLNTLNFMILCLWLVPKCYQRYVLIPFVFWTWFIL